MQLRWKSVFDIQWYLNTFYSHVLRVVVFWLVSIFLLRHAIQLPTKFWVVTWSFPLLLHQQICVDVKWVSIQLVQLLFSFIVKIDSIDRWLKWWAKSRRRHGGLHHLFSLPFSIFYLIEFLAGLQTYAFISASSRANFVVSLSTTIPDSILKNLAATGSLLSTALTKNCKVLHENSTTL